MSMMKEVDLNEESLMKDGPNSFFSKFNTIAFNRHNRLLERGTLNVVDEDGSEFEEGTAMKNSQ
jgi:hypothetical protein